MLREWRSELNRLLILIAIAATLGAILGETTLVVMLAVLGYLAQMMFQLYRLNHWLEDLPDSEQKEPPEATGVWGWIFDGIYRLQRRERDAVNHLKNILDKAQESSAALEMAVVMINHRGNLEWWNRRQRPYLASGPNRTSSKESRTCCANRASWSISRAAITPNRCASPRPSRRA